MQPDKNVNNKLALTKLLMKLQSLAPLLLVCILVVGIFAPFVVSSDRATDMVSALFVIQIFCCATLFLVSLFGLFHHDTR